MEIVKTYRDFLSLFPTFHASSHFSFLPSFPETKGMDRVDL